MKVLRGQRQFADGARLNRLTGCRSAGFYRLHLGLNFDLFLNGHGTQFGLHTRGFSDAHRDISKLRLLKARACDVDGVSTYRQQCDGKPAVAVRFRGAGQSASVLIYDPHIGVGHHRSARIQDGSGDRAGSATLREHLAQ